MNDPSFKFETNVAYTAKPYTSYTHMAKKPATLWQGGSTRQSQTTNRVILSAHKTEVQDFTKAPVCVIHGDKAKHALPDCRQFQSMAMNEKKDLFRKHGICFK